MILKYFNDIKYLFSQISTYNKKSNKKVESIKIDIVNFVEYLCEDYEVHGCVNFSSSTEEGIVYIQIKEMKRAFSNIINNAIKYAGCVDIDISRKQEFIGGDILIQDLVLKKLISIKYGNLFSL